MALAAIYVLSLAEAEALHGIFPPRRVVVLGVACIRLARAMVAELKRRVDAQFEEPAGGENPQLEEAAGDVMEEGGGDNKEDEDVQPEGVEQQGDSEPVWSSRSEAGQWDKEEGGEGAPPRRAPE